MHQLQAGNHQSCMKDMCPVKMGRWGDGANEMAKTEAAAAGAHQARLQTLPDGLRVVAVAVRGLCRRRRLGQRGQLDLQPGRRHGKVESGRLCRRCLLMLRSCRCCLSRWQGRRPRCRC